MLVTINFLVTLGALLLGFFSGVVFTLLSNQDDENEKQAKKQNKDLKRMEKARQRRQFDEQMKAEELRRQGVTQAYERRLDKLNMEMSKLQEAYYEQQTRNRGFGKQLGLVLNDSLEDLSTQPAK